MARSIPPNQLTPQTTYQSRSHDGQPDTFRHHVRCTTTPGRGGLGRPSGLPSGLLPEGGLTSGSATRPVARGGDTPRENLGKVGKTEPNQAKSLTKRQKLAKKTTKIIKNGHFFFCSWPPPRAAPPPPRPEGALTPGCAAPRTTRTSGQCGAARGAPEPPLPGVVVRHTSAEGICVFTAF